MSFILGVLLFIIVMALIEPKQEKNAKWSID
jgi:hypothetical protein